jgi:hypothetical protein
MFTAADMAMTTQIDIPEGRMSENETDITKLVKQIAEDVRWLRQRAEKRDQIQKQEDMELLKLIEQTHRGPKSRE